MFHLDATTFNMRPKNHKEISEADTERIQGHNIGKFITFAKKKNRTDEQDRRKYVYNI